MAINYAVDSQPCRSPVFVLTASRSGSTLLRFILDSHPDLACPPETSIAAACAALARSWYTLENAESGQRRPQAKPVTLPAHAALTLRATVDQIYEGYLLRRGKKRWCDKSLDTHQVADLITQVYPDAKFICLFRHCMDVVASGVEVCPWGLHRFGFDPFAAQFPGNNVAAIGSYWLSCAQAITAFHDEHQERCHRVRYEDLVTEPEETAAAIFSFLGVPQAPGIAEASFQTGHEDSGPGDEKIWFTTGITSASMGRGVSVPAGALPAPLRESINEMLARLGYRQVDDDWGTFPGNTDPRVDGGSHAEDACPAAELAEPASSQQDQVRSAARAIAARTALSDDKLREIAARWPSVAGSTVLLVVRSGEAGHEEVRVSLGPGTDAEPDEEPAARLIASAGTWLALLNGKANVITEVTASRLRCVNKKDTHRIRSDELHAVAALLGIATVPVARTGAPVTRSWADEETLEPVP